MTRPKRKNLKPPSKSSDSVDETSGELSSESGTTVTNMPVKRSKRAVTANKAWETLIPKSRDSTPVRNTDPSSSERRSKSVPNPSNSKIADISDPPSKVSSQKKSAPVKKVVSAPAVLKSRGQVTEPVPHSPVVKKNNRNARSNAKETETVVLETKRGRTRSNLREPDTTSAKVDKSTPKISQESSGNAKKAKIVAQTVQDNVKGSPTESSKQSKGKAKDTKTPDKNNTKGKKEVKEISTLAENNHDEPNKSEEVEISDSKPRRGKSRLKEIEPCSKNVYVCLENVNKISKDEGIGASIKGGTSKEKVDDTKEEHGLKKSTRSSRSASKLTPRGSESDKSSKAGRSATILTPVSDSDNNKSLTGKRAGIVTPEDGDSSKISVAKGISRRDSIGKINTLSAEDVGLRASKKDCTPMSISSPRKRKSRGDLTDSKPDEPGVKKVAMESRKTVAFGPETKATKSRAKSVIKAPPKKSLCNMDILNLLDDGEEDDVEKAVEEITETAIQEETEGVVNESSGGQNSSLTRVKEKVPIWKQHTASANSSHLSKDVFNPENYGEEEFGPEDLAPKKKRVRKKKKDTKAILVFGKTKANVAKKAVKESHNLNTPGGANKKTKRVIPPIIPTNPTMETRKVNRPPFFPTNPSSVPQTPSGPTVVVTNYTSDVSTGAQNYFDSEIHQQDVGTDFDEVPEQEEVNRSGAFGTSLMVPKSYTTPAVPKKISRLQTKNASTPNTNEREELGAKVLQEASIKELIKKNFGFDDYTDDDTDESLGENDISMSPVKRVPNHSAMFGDSLLLGTSSNRLSNVSTNPSISSHQVDRLSSRVKIINKKPNRRDGPFRFNLEPARNPLLLQVEAMRRKKAREQEKGRVGKGKKLTKKAHKHKTEEAVLEQSSLYEDLRAESVPSGGHLIQSKLVLGGNRKEDKKEQQGNSDKENGDNNNTGDQKEKSKLTVSRTYTRKNANSSSKSSSNNSTLGQSEKILKTPKKQNKQKTKAESWAKLQTSHFSEVDDFDLSFG